MGHNSTSSPRRGTTYAARGRDLGHAKGGALAGSWNAVGFRSVRRGVTAHGDEDGPSVTRAGTIKYGKAKAVAQEWPTTLRAQVVNA